MNSQLSRQLMQVYLGVFVVATLSLIAIGLYAQTTTRTQNTLPEFLGNNTEQNCPDFEIADHSIRDVCTGLVWSRAQLPTQKTRLDENPGYTHDEAVAGCSALTPAGTFRLPTVEEALTLVSTRCDAQGCHNQSPLVVAGGADGSGDVVGPSEDDSFFGGVFWTSNDFNEPASYREGNSARDYFRSVNLMTGKVDSPVYGKEVKLNAWCIATIAPSEFSKAVNEDELVTVYQRSCLTDDQCIQLTGENFNISNPRCIDGRCQGTVGVSTPQVSDASACAADTHVEGVICESDLGPVCSPSSEQVLNASYQMVWQGNVFNGDYDGCSLTGCDEGFHWNPTAPLIERCEANLTTTCDFNVPTATEWSSLVGSVQQSWLESWDYAYPPTSIGPLVFGEGNEYATGWGVCEATSCVGEGVTTQLRETGGNQYCGCFGDDAVGSDSQYYWNGSSCAPRIERVTVGDVNNVPFATSSVRSCDGGAEPWKGPNAGGCQLTEYRAESCITNAALNGSGGCECVPGYGDNNNNATVGDSCDQGYVVEYYKGTNFEDLRSTVTSSSIDFDWGNSGPTELNLPSYHRRDLFSIRATRAINLETGKHQFRVRSDDGIRVYLTPEGGARQTIIDRWTESAFNGYTTIADIPQSGSYTVEIEYYEGYGDAYISFDMTPVPTYTAEYYSNNDLQGAPVLTNTVNVINFDWDDGSPDASVPNDNFSIRYSGTVSLWEGDYQFVLNSNNGYRIIVDGDTIRENWGTSSAVSTNPVVSLSAGEHTIVIEYNEKTVTASLEFYYYPLP